jgi:uncharacterized damage-inducible protein DinB
MDTRQAEFLIDQFASLWEEEHPATCAVLEAVPDGRRDYKPDEKSRTAWELVTHIATSDVWFIDSVINSKFVFDQAKAKAHEESFRTVAEVVAFYKQQIPGRLNAARAVNGEQLAADVDFFGIMKRPGAAWLGFASNHSIHHRGQLAAYLRSMGSKVPAIYGPSADGPMG